MKKFFSKYAEWVYILSAIFFMAMAVLNYIHGHKAMVVILSIFSFIDLATFVSYRMMDKDLENLRN